MSDLSQIKQFSNSTFLTHAKHLSSLPACKFVTPGLSVPSLYARYTPLHGAFNTVTTAVAKLSEEKPVSSSSEVAQLAQVGHGSNSDSVVSEFSETYPKSKYEKVINKMNHPSMFAVEKIEPTSASATTTTTTGEKRKFNFFRGDESSDEEERQDLKVFKWTKS